ncbi:putative transcription factor WD40-like family [Helianthus anomalus]
MKITVHDPLLSPSVSGNRKKQKMNPSGHSQSFGGPPQRVPLPTPSSARRAPVTGPKGKNKKSHPPSGSTTGRAQLGNRVTSGAHANETAETPSFSPLIGRKVRTRWPDDNNFYEATITDYNPVEAWNVQTSAELSLNGPVGQVYSLVVGNDLLFVGTQDGSILAWKYNAATVLNQLHHFKVIPNKLYSD